MKKWRCTVCGYVHTGEEPPGACPVCGALKDKFVAFSEPAETETAVHDETTADFLIVGSGGAAFAAAATAVSLGASVIMLEKAAQTGGTTARSGGGFWVPNNRYQKEIGIYDNKNDCLKYMARYSYPNFYDPTNRTLGLHQHEYELLESYYDNATKMVDYFVENHILDVMMEINWTGKPQVDYMDHLPQNKGFRGRSLYPKNKDGTLGYGTDLIRQLEDYATLNGATILRQHEVVQILQDSTKKVIGLTVKTPTGNRDFHAKKGVIFGSGGYSHNPELMMHFQRGPHYGGCSVPTNTGDFIKMGAAIGAQLGNMAGAFRAQSMIEEALKNPGGSSNVFYIAGDSVIIVNKYGKRIMDEKRNYTDRTMLHFVWDPQNAEWKNMITFLIFDERTASLWQGFPPYPVKGEMPHYLVKAKTLDELEIQLKARLKAIGEHTGDFHLDSDFYANLRNTILEFNEDATLGKDRYYNRGEYTYDREWTTFPPTIPNVTWPEAKTKNYTMYPISDKGPYYAVILAAGTLDTNGGPMINGKGQVLDTSYNPIAGLYGAGNCIASPTANAYWGAGATIGPAMTFGYLSVFDAMDK